MDLRVSLDRYLGLLLARQLVVAETGPDSQAPFWRPILDQISGRAPASSVESASDQGKSSDEQRTVSALAVAFGPVVLKELMAGLGVLNKFIVGLTYFVLRSDISNVNRVLISPSFRAAGGTIDLAIICSLGLTSFPAIDFILTRGDEAERLACLYGGLVGYRQLEILYPAAVLPGGTFRILTQIWGSARLKDYVMTKALLPTTGIFGAIPVAGSSSAAVETGPPAWPHFHIEGGTAQVTRFLTEYLSALDEAIDPALARFTAAPAQDGEPILIIFRLEGVRGIEKSTIRDRYQAIQETHPHSRVIILYADALPDYPRNLKVSDAADRLLPSVACSWDRDVTSGEMRLKFPPEHVKKLLALYNS